MRKKTIELIKAHKLTLRTAKEMEHVFKNEQPFPLVNPKFAYQIHRLALEEQQPKLPRKKVLTELKLKFLESDGVSESSWEQWFNREESLLILGHPSSQAKVKVGLMLGQSEKGEVKFEWMVKDATICDKHHLSLFELFTEYRKWAKKNEEDWENTFLQSCVSLIHNLPACLFILNLKETFGIRFDSYSQAKLPFGTEKMDNSIHYEWEFPIFSNPSRP